MRELTSKEKVEAFMKALGRVSQTGSRVYFTGGVTAVLFGWREATVDVDLRFEPELDENFRALPGIKESLRVNIELAAPSDFIPELPGWETRSNYIGREGSVSFYHYDIYSQALSKIERGHAQDRKDVDSMLREGLIEKHRLAELFKEIEPQLYRYPAIDPSKFASAVKEITNSETE